MSILFVFFSSKLQSLAPKNCEKKKIQPKTRNAVYKKNKFKAQLVQNELNELKWIEID